MTDKKALEVLKSWLRLAYQNADGTDDDSAELYEALQTVFALINRQKAELNQYAEEQHELMIEKDKLFDIAEKQKAEIENLNIELQAMRNAANGYKKEVERLKGWQNLLKAEKHSLIKAEAIKEFAERLKKRMGFCDLPMEIVKHHIDNLLKETVGDADGFSNRA